MKVHKTIAKALAFEHACLKLGYKLDQIKFESVKQDDLIENRRLIVDLNGLKIDCFGYLQDSNFNMNEFRSQFDKLSPEGKECFVKANSEFIIHHRGSLDLFSLRQLPHMLKLNNQRVPCLAN